MMNELLLYISVDKNLTIRERYLVPAGKAA
jgi:hypothetical protein